MKKESSKKNNKVKNNKENKKNNVLNKIVEFLKLRKWIIIIILVIIIIIALILIFTRKKDKFALNDIYNRFPEEARKLYSNVVSVSCYGDLHLDIGIDAGKTDVSEMSKNNLLDYMFSYLDKNGRLSDKFDIAVINDAQNKLFLGNVKPFDDVKTYDYGNYTYTVNGRNITRKVKKCTSDNRYVSHLYGGVFKDDMISMDVSVGYLKDGILYDYNNHRLGEYDGDVTKLPELMPRTTYYRFIYTKENGVYKLTSVEHKNRT